MDKATELPKNIVIVPNVEIKMPFFISDKIPKQKRPNGKKTTKYN
jgi:hypothetical protein